MTTALRQNGGIISLKGLRAIGISDVEVAAFVLHGDLRRLHRGVYADGRNRLTDDAHPGRKPA
jgi:Transcriptional regulator, AbiEi antitoxin